MPAEAPTPAQVVSIALTSDQWGQVQDALELARAMAAENEAMWRGRTREARYRREREEAEALWNEIEKQRIP